MDISKNVKPEAKERIANLSIECQVLQNLLAEKKAQVQQELLVIVKENTQSPQLYNLECNPHKDKWDLVLKPKALVIPEHAKLPRNS